MKRGPVWLQTRWERRKQETVSRVTAAVEILRQQAREVAFSNICVAVKELYGVSISSNTLKRNESAYQIYLAHRKPPKKGIELDFPILSDIYLMSGTGSELQHVPGSAAA
jgi:hypothetical protein